VDEKLQEAADSTEIKSIVESFLLNKARSIKKVMPFDLAMIELLKHNGNLPIEKVASLACVSIRQFERLSKERIGLPPKLYSRITRFSKAYRLREEQPQLTWTRIAYECGYFDQMHFIRDFREFAGITPKLAEKALEKQPVRMQAGLRL
jgi:AraC-like DNA-binding protein